MTALCFAPHTRHSISPVDSSTTFITFSFFVMLPMSIGKGDKIMEWEIGSDTLPPLILEKVLPSCKRVIELRSDTPSHLQTQHINSCRKTKRIIRQVQNKWNSKGAERKRTSLLHLPAIHRHAHATVSLQAQHVRKVTSRLEGSSSRLQRKRKNHNYDHNFQPGNPLIRFPLFFSS